MEYLFLQVERRQGSNANGGDSHSAGQCKKAKQVRYVRHTYDRQVDQTVPGGRRQEVYPAPVHAGVHRRGSVHRQMSDWLPSVPVVRVMSAVGRVCRSVKVRSVAECRGRRPPSGRGGRESRGRRLLLPRIVPAYEYTSNPLNRIRHAKCLMARSCQKYFARYHQRQHQVKQQFSTLKLANDKCQCDTSEIKFRGNGGDVEGPREEETKLQLKFRVTPMQAIEVLPSSRRC